MTSNPLTTNPEPAQPHEEMLACAAVRATSQNKNLAKEILDKWATVIVRKCGTYEKNGTTIVNSDKYEDYTPDNYKEDIVLWIPPKDCMRLEFEFDDHERNVRVIREIESAAKSLGIQYCVTEHAGCKSPYFNIFGLKGIPLNHENKLAKDILIDMLLPANAKGELDKTNLGWTLSPVIWHEHWKKKYNGAIHAVVRGTSPMDQINEYPKSLLSLIKKSKQKNKATLFKLKRSAQWVEDFLINYCTEHELPAGNRHCTIEKNLAALIIHREDKDEITAKYLEAQKRSTNTLRTWFVAVANGQYTEISAGEISNFIKEHRIPYTIYDQQKKEEKNLSVTETDYNILRSSDLLDRICAQFDKKIVGEDRNRKAIFLNGCGKWVLNASISSYNLCINSNSGAGKDYTCKAVLKIFPPDDVVMRSRISPTTFTYWHNSKFEPDWTWDNKVCLLSDVSNNILNSEVFKLMCSDGNHSTVVINQMAVDIEIKGKPVMYITTASANPNNEMLRRFPILQLDETIDQTKAIKTAQARAAATGLTLDYDNGLINALSKLFRVKVKVPFASQLVDSFPDDHIIMRTHFGRLLDYIKASAALHQFQREQDGEGYILATPVDYDHARVVLEATTTNPMMIPLTKKQRELLDVCKDLKDFCVSDLIPKVPFLVQSKIYDALDKLQELGFLTSCMKDIEGKKKPIRYYQYKEYQLKSIPTWQEIEDSCRKKGIVGIEGNKESKGSEGNNNQKDVINSLNSLNSPTTLTPKFSNQNDQKQNGTIAKIKKFFEKKTQKEQIPKKTFLQPAHAELREVIKRLDVGQGVDVASIAAKIQQPETITRQRMAVLIGSGDIFECQKGYWKVLE